MADTKRYEVRLYSPTHDANADVRTFTWAASYDAAFKRVESTVDASNPANIFYGWTFAVVPRLTD